MAGEALPQGGSAAVVAIAMSARLGPGGPGPGFEIVWKRERVWTCKLHDRPWADPDDPFDPDPEDEWVWPEPGCTCETSARWRYTGRTVMTKELWVSRMLRDHYLPAVMETLNTECMRERFSESR
jgi:hypothetical protein